jgi:hypothetical protein
MAIRAQNARLLADLQARTQDALAAQRLAEEAAQAKARQNAFGHGDPFGLVVV